MENKFKLYTNNRQLLVVLTALAIVATVYFMPKTKTDHYIYSVGKPWTYGMLIAPFNFQVEKSDAQYQAELDSVEQAFEPCFVFDANAGSDARRMFEQNINSGVALSAQAVIALGERLETVYSEGIVQAADERLLGSRPMVRLYRNSIPTRRAADSFRSERDALNYVAQADLSAEDQYILAGKDLTGFIKANVKHDSEMSDRELAAQKEKVSRFSGEVYADQKIIGQGEIVDPDRLQMIESYLKNMNERGATIRFLVLTWIGQAIYATLCFAILLVYLLLYRLDYVESAKIQIFLLGSITLFTVLTGIYTQYTNWNIMIIPATMLAIILRTFLDSRTSFMGFITYITVSSVMTSMQSEYLILQIVAGLTGIFSLKELSQRSQILRTCLFIFLAYSVVWFSMQLIRLEFIADLDLKTLALFATNCLLLLMVYPLLFVIEKMFGFTSNVTMMELSNFNQPLLKMLAENAPGTFQHSIQVSSLASEAASKIRANSMLVRTAALYHDIGKLENPPFFTENQNGVNPHEPLTPQESATIITGHVTDGVRLAEKYGLPNVIKEMILTHHGLGVARFFWYKFRQENPDVAECPKEFCYPGPDPNTKEAAVLMMADAVEAASRSLKEYTEESIGSLVDKIVDTQVSEGHFNACAINYQEIVKVKSVFKERLKTMYHTRISYPEFTVGQHQTKE